MISLYGGYKTKTRHAYEERKHYPIFGVLVEGRTSRTTRGMTILYCPKDEPNDLEPMFKPGACFTYDNFLVSLESSRWPIGMEFELKIAEIMFDDKVKRAYRYEFVRNYVIPGASRYNKSVGEVSAMRELHNLIIGDVDRFHRSCVEDFERKKNQ